MTNEARKICGFILLSVPTIIYGGYFLLTVLSGQQEHLQLTDFQKSMFRAGHAHAGVLVIFALLVQLFVDHASLSKNWKWIARLSFPISAITVSLGFFAAAIGKQITEPTRLILILYFGIGILIFGLLTLGVGLIRQKKGSP
jgi:drug/metabolite transporter superfamily protein YnfA